MGNWILFTLLVAGFWFWWDTLQAKQRARDAGLNACQTASVQFLDDTVEHKKLWLRRGPRGNLQICRLYFFEFTSDGSERYHGRVTLVGENVKEVEMDAYRIPPE